MASVDHFMRGIGNLKVHGVTPQWGPGRHGPGDNVFCYFLGPENAPIEYTGEMQQIDAGYRAGQPDDWKWPPGRVDHWGIMPKATERMEKAGENYRFTDNDWKLDEWQ
jgi:catechol 2,3-dioxygenase